MHVMDVNSRQLILGSRIHDKMFNIQLDREKVNKAKLGIQWDEGPLRNNQGGKLFQKQGYFKA